MLAHFPEKLRHSISLELDLPWSGQEVPVPRDDGGPPLALYKPHSTLLQPIDSTDAQLGGVSMRTQFDENGFCALSAEAKLLSRYDLVAVGDSFTWCTGVTSEKTWPAQLATLSSLTTYNMSRCCIGLYEYVQFFKHFALKYKPKYAVFAFSQGNDLRDAAKFHKYKIKPPTEPSFSSTLVNSIYLYNYFKAGMRLLFKAKEKENFRYQVFYQGRWMPFNIVNGDLDEVRYARSLAAKEINLSLLDEALTHIAALQTTYGTKILLLYIPSPYSVFDQVVFADPTLEPILRNLADSQREYLKNFALSHGLGFVDATPHLKQYNQTQNLTYLPANLHLSPAGHRAVAEVVWRSLRQSK